MTSVAGQEEVEIVAVNSHRNGVGGAPFCVVQFRMLDPYQGKRPHMLATVFDERFHVAVLDMDDLEQCWRGDYFEDKLRHAVQQWDDAFVIGQGSCWPTSEQIHQPRNETHNGYANYETCQPSFRQLVNRSFGIRCRALATP